MVTAYCSRPGMRSDMPGHAAYHCMTEPDGAYIGSDWAACLCTVQCHSNVGLGGWAGPARDSGSAGSGASGCAYLPDALHYTLTHAILTDLYGWVGAWATAALLVIVQQWTACLGMDLNRQRRC